MSIQGDPSGLVVSGYIATALLFMMALELLLRPLRRLVYRTVAMTIAAASGGTLWACKAFGVGCLYLLMVVICATTIGAVIVVFGLVWVYAIIAHAWEGDLEE